MSMVKPSPLRTVIEDPLPKDSELIEAAKAIRDEVLSEADKRFDAKLENLGWDKDSELIEAAKAIRDEVLEEADRKFDSKLSILKKYILDSVSDSLEWKKEQRFKDLETGLTKTIHDDFSTRFKYLEDKVSEAGDKSKGLESLLEKSLTAMVKVFEAGQMQMVDAIRNMPVPNVHLSVPVDAIRIEQSSPIINLPKDSIRIEQSPSVVNLPDGAITVNVNQQPSIVNLPKDAISVSVNQQPSIVNLPKDSIRIEQSSPVVNLPKNAITVNVKQQPSIVNLPKDSINVEHRTILEREKGKKFVQKTIVYDSATGRPAKIMEETTDE